MILDLCSESKVDFSDLTERFSPFLAEKCKLPFCCIQLRNKTEMAKLFADSVFFPFIEGEIPADALNVNCYYFSLCGDGVAVCDGKGIAIWVHDDFRKIEVSFEEESFDPMALQQFIMRAYQYTALYSGVLMIHSACVEYDGEGILFCGVPGAGKSTQARLWEKVFGAQALNNDQPCLIENENGFVVHGSPWSGKEPCYKNEFYPVKAIVFIEKHAENRIERMSPLEAFGLLHLNNYIPPMTDTAEQLYDELIERVISRIPVYRQYCTKTDEAPRTLMRYFRGEKIMKYKAGENFIIRTVAGEKVLMARGAGAVEFGGMVIFNETGLFLWELLRFARSAEELADALVEKYEITAQQASEDIAAFLEKSLAEGIITASEE